MVVSNIFYFYPYLGKLSNLTNLFQLGWNHELVFGLSTNFALQDEQFFSLGWLYHVTFQFGRPWWCSPFRPKLTEIGVFSQLLVQTSLPGYFAERGPAMISCGWCSPLYLRIWRCWKKSKDYRQYRGMDRVMKCWRKMFMLYTQPSIIWVHLHICKRLAQLL